MRPAQRSVVSAVSWALLAAAAVLHGTSASAKSVSNFLSADAAEVATRSLLNTQNVIETDAPIEETLTDACRLGGGVEDFFQSGTSGEVCQLAASVIGRGNKRVYSWELHKHHDNLSFQIVLQPLEGEPIVSVEHQRPNGDWSVEKLETWSSGNSLIYVLNSLRAGKSRVVLESEAIVSTFSLRIEFFRGDVPVHEDSVLVLKLIKEQCCKADDPCTGVLDMLGTDEEIDICSSAGNHCDGAGHLTHLDLSESNMHCDLAHADFPLLGLDQLQVFMLNDNDVKGDLNNPEVLKRFSQLLRLEILELGNLPGLTGSIPPGCTRPFTNLIHLGVSNTSVGGELPPCIVNSVHQLEISNTRFQGAFPEVTASAQLRYLLAETSVDSEYKFTGKLPNLEYAEHLHYANLDNHNFEGALTLANNIEAIRVQNNSLSEVRVLNAPRLQLVDVAGNQLSGPLPPAFAKMPQLLGLHVDGNQLSSLPISWQAGNLRDFTASGNQLEGRIPAVFGSMPHLRRLVLAGNKLTGQLDDFSANIPPHSKLQWVDLSDNHLTGPIFAPALIKLAVFSSMRDEFQTEFDKQALHVFRARNNKLIGDVSVELLQAYERQVTAGANMDVDLRDNDLSCPDADALERTNLEAEAISALGCGKRSKGGTARRAVVGTLVALLLVGLLAGGAVVYKRRKQRNSWYKDPAALSAAQYASESDAGTRSNGTGWFTGRPSSQQYSSSLDNPGANNGAWGFLPFMSKSKQPVSSLLGNTGWSNQNPGSGYQGMQQNGGGMQLPVSHDRRNLNVAVNGQRPGAAVTSVELVSPRSDVSAGSLPRNGAGINGIDGGDDDMASDGSRSERQMRVAFNAAYTPVNQDQ